MGDLATLAKARRELEELYSGVPDESVNLTFQDLAEVKHFGISPEKRKSSVNQSKQERETVPLTKLPSIDFSRALEEAAAATASSRKNNYQHHHLPPPHPANKTPPIDSSRSRHHHEHHHAVLGFEHHYGADTRSMASSYDEMSMMSTNSMFPGGRRRPGIPHSNICTVCTTYIYLFRNRCLVCGRVYCRQCVNTGMGEMAEGRKCVECLGRKFSQRYIQRAGQIGCCMGYPSSVKQQELKWAEKGPRRSGENRLGRSSMLSRSRTPAMPTTPTRHSHPSSPPSFVMNSPYSAYSPTNHPLPF